MNLYDTLHLNVIYMTEPISTPKGLKAEFDDKKKGTSTESYHLYTKHESKSLVEFFKSKKHILSELISVK